MRLTKSYGLLDYNRKILDEQSKCFLIIQPPNTLENTIKPQYNKSINMNTKFLIPTMLFVLTLGLTNCSKNCETKIATCNETPSSDEICYAYFHSWFYNKEKNQCERIAYTGCSQKGFATQKECKECKCK